MRAETRRFWIRLVLAVLPGIAYVVILTGVPMWAGELSSLDTVVRRQQDGSVRLFGRAYSDNVAAYKHNYLEARRASVVAIGSSRILLLRFPDNGPSCFYNAGSVAQYSTAATAFLQSLSGKARPDLVILSMDHHWFNQSADARRAIPEKTSAEDRPGLYRGLNISRLFLADILAGKIDWGRIATRQDPISGQRSMGLNAIINGNGFLPNGSYQYGWHMKHPVPLNVRIREAMDSYRGGEAQYLPGQNLSQKGMHDLEVFLDSAHARGIRVVGILPPFMPTIHSMLAADPNYGYLRGLPDTLAALFKKKGETFVDFSNPESIGGSDESMNDGIHAAIPLMSRVREELLVRSPALARTLTRCERSLPDGSDRKIARVR